MDYEKFSRKDGNYTWYDSSKNETESMFGRYIIYNITDLAGVVDLGIPGGNDIQYYCFL